MGGDDVAGDFEATDEVVLRELARPLTPGIRQQIQAREYGEQQNRKFQLEYLRKLSNGELFKGPPAVPASTLVGRALLLGLAAVAVVILVVMSLLAR